jgi:hypothetical protein
VRTTLELDDELVATAKKLARQEGVTLGQYISELARQALAAKQAVQVRNGVLLFVPRAGAAKPDLRIVDQLRDDA